MSIGARIRRLRKEHGWTLKDLSQVSGVPGSTISDLEHGRSVNSVGTTLVKIAAAFNVDVLWLQTGEGLPVRKAEPRIDEAEMLRVFGRLTPANRDAVLATARALLSSQGETPRSDTPPDPSLRKLQ